MKIDPPHLLLLIAKAQGLEGDGYFGLPAPFGNPGLGIPDAVPLPIALGSIVADLHVCSGSSGIDVKHDSVAIVVEGIQGNGEGVTLAGREIPAHLGDHNPLLSCRIKAVNAHVKILIIVKKPHLGDFAR